MSFGTRAGLDSAAQTQEVRPVAFGAVPRFGLYDDLTFSTLDWVMEQMFPADTAPDGVASPGNRQLCAASYIEAVQQMLGLGVNGSPATFIPLAMAAFNQTSTILNAKNFPDITFAQQFAIMNLVALGTAPGSIWVTLAGLGFSQTTIFASLLGLSKVPFINNWPVTQFRDQYMFPILTDEAHLISNPNNTNLQTGWQIIKFPGNASWQLEKLLLAWIAGKEVNGFNGLPTYSGTPDVNVPDLSDGQRLSAKTQLYQLSTNGQA